MRLLFFLLTLTSSVPVHDFYVSMTDIAWDDTSNVLGFSSRFFADDIEEALEELEGQRIVLSDDMSKESALLLENYYLDHLELNDESGALDIDFLGFQFQDDLIWCFAECKRRPDENTVVIKANWLIERFQTQSNIIHFSSTQGMRTLILNKSDPESRLDE